MNNHTSSTDGSPHEPTGKYVSVGTDAESVDTVNGSRSSGTEVEASPAMSPDSKQFGDFEILEKIAQGGMGAVYRARDCKLNRIVALKMILSGRLASEDAVRRFRTEAEAAARLDHPGIVPVYEVGERDGQQYMVMAYIEGGSLAGRLKDGPLPARDGAELARRLADAVAYAHDKGIIHRDLKPGNVLLSADFGPRHANSGSSTASGKSLSPSLGTPKIADFGLAKLAQNDSELTRTGEIIGTPAYMPPEQAAGRVAEVGPASDIYSLGAILYCMLTGRPPFQASSPLDTLLQVLEQEPVAPRLLNRGVPRDLETICLKCLHKEPHKRYHSAAELSQDLQCFLDGRPILARSAGVTERSVKWIRRNPWAAALMVALTAGVIASSTGAFLAIRQRDRAIAAERQRTIEEQERVAAQRQRLIDSHLASAQLALQRGAWRDAVMAYERAEADGLELTIPMRLERVRALFGLSQMERVQQELDDISKNPDVGKHAASVDLFRGDLQLGINNAEAERLLKRALSGNLPDGDAWYARGLLAKRTGDALQCFRNAVAHDRFHREARNFIGLLLPLLGRVDEGLAWLQQCEMLFPDDPQFQMLLGICQDLRGDLAAANRHWRRTEHVFPADATRLIRNALSMLPKLGVLLEQSSGLRDSKDAGPLIQGALAYNQLRTVAGRFEQVTRPLKTEEDALTQAAMLRMPFALQPLYRFINHLSEMFEAEKKGRDLLEEVIRDEKQFKELVQLIDDADEGLSRYYHGLMLTSRALMFSAGPNRDDQRMITILREAAAVYDRARNQPGFIDTRRIARHGYASTLAHIGSPDRQGNDPAMRALAVKEIRELMRQEPLPSSIRGIYLKAARNAKDWNLARDILDEWDRRSPNDIGQLRARAQIELEAGSFSQAAYVAKLCLDRDAKDAEAKRIHDQALAKLKQQFPEIAAGK